MAQGTGEDDSGRGTLTATDLMMADAILTEAPTMRAVEVDGEDAAGAALLARLVALGERLARADGAAALEAADDALLTAWLAASDVPDGGAA